MSGILHKLNHFLKELNRFVLPSNIQNPNHVISDQLTSITLKKCLEKIVEGKEEDFEITHDDLLALIKLTEKYGFNNTTLSQLANEIKTECNDVIIERAALLKAILDLVFHCKAIRDVSFVDKDKVSSKISAIFKRLFKHNEHYKSEDIILFIHLTETQTIYAALNKFAYFSSGQFQQYTENQLQYFKEVLTELSTARKSVVSSPILAARPLKLTAITQLMPSSAPNSPVTANVDTAMMRSRSLPDAAKAHKAAAQIEKAPAIHPQDPRRMRSSSDSPLNVSEEFQRVHGSGASTASTLLPDDMEPVSDLFFSMKLGPSSNSEDDSDSKKVPTIPKKEEEKKHKNRRSHHKF